MVAFVVLGAATALAALDRQDEAKQWLADAGIPAADHCGDAVRRVELRISLGALLASGNGPELRRAVRTLREAARIAEAAGLEELRSEVREMLRALTR